MGRRYSDIRRGGRLNAALTAYTNYLQTAATRVPGVGTGTARPPQVDLAIVPFNADVATGDFWLARVSEPARALMGSAVATRAQATSTTVAANRIPGYKPAKIVMFAGSGTSTVATSAITGQRYLRYAGQTYSHPFGRATGTDREQEEYNAIRAALEGPNRRFSLQSETIGAR